VRRHQAVRVEGERATGTWDVLAMITTKEGRAMWMVGVEHDEVGGVTLPQPGVPPEPAASGSRR